MVLLFFMFALAQEKSPMQLMLEQNQLENVQESTVSIQGLEYRKLEYKGESFYFSTLLRDESIPKYFCEKPGGYRSERLVEGSLKIRKRKVLFFQALQEKCSTRGKGGRETNNKNSWVEVNPIIGIHLPESPNDLIKNKKIGFPLDFNSIIFSGEF